MRMMHQRPPSHFTPRARTRSKSTQDRSAGRTRTTMPKLSYGPCPCPPLLPLRPHLLLHLTLYSSHHRPSAWHRHPSPERAYPTAAHRYGRQNPVEKNRRPRYPTRYHYHERLLILPPSVSLPFPPPLPPSSPSSRPFASAAVDRLQAHLHLLHMTSLDGHPPTPLIPYVS
ncbi:hypothetical protein DFP72DRAFT_207447 [Ephemerocybe angulata]|uniref:Uncharacterized protein n=1 Tax=Ephemerocybe angulata TaxID=980116 RepID=A0A8H6IK16_9AGAR|nr:hypothetical protein DFP72DRAFT_207447 [Tulosesus angulatus]